MSVTYLGTCKGNLIRDLATAVDQKEVTHLVAAYRTKEGDLRYHLIGEDDLTYLLGMLERVQTHMHCLDSFVIPEP